jgi:hypothetical protein
MAYHAELQVWNGAPLPASCQAQVISCVDSANGIGQTSSMHGILFLTLLSNSAAPIPSRVDAAIDLSTITLTQALDFRQSATGPRRCYDNEWAGRKLVECWHTRDLHCLLILRRGEALPEHGRFVVEGTLRVWNYRINGKLVEGWTMIRVENTTLTE